MMMMMMMIVIVVVPIAIFLETQRAPPGAVESRIEKRREEMAAGTFKYEPQDMLDMLLPSLQWGETCQGCCFFPEIQEAEVSPVNQVNLWTCHAKF